MRVEWPELKRCCCCMPLRHGLITWGYIRLILELLLTAVVTSSLVHILRYLWRHPAHANGYIEDAIFTCLFLTILVVDISFTLVFIIGGHQKSARLLHVYYIYSLVCLGFNILGNISVAVMDLILIHNILEYTHSSADTGISIFMSIIESRLIFGIFLIGIHVYTILLTRSEAKKLRSISKYRYINPLLEAQGSVENGTVTRGDSAAVETPSNEPGTQFQRVIDQSMNVNNDTFTYKKF